MTRSTGRGRCSIPGSAFRAASSRKAGSTWCTASTSEDAPPLKLRLKVEINTREHFTEQGVVRVPFRVDDPWFTGAADATTYALDELLCTKLRALYQRKKGRDLFDLWHALRAGGRINPSGASHVLPAVPAEEGRAVTRAQFEENLAGKRTDPDFRDDVGPTPSPGFRLGLRGRVRLRHGERSREARRRAVEGRRRHEMMKMKTPPTRRAAHTGLVVPHAWRRELLFGGKLLECRVWDEYRERPHALDRR